MATKKAAPVTKITTEEMAEQLLIGNIGGRRGRSLKLPRDKNRRTINPGDTIRLTFNARQRERPGARRVAIHGMSGNEVVVSDEGALLAPAVHWVDFYVEWNGACLIARRVRASDFQVVMSGECTSVSTGKPVSASSATTYLNAAFNGADFEVLSSKDKRSG